MRTKTLIFTFLLISITNQIFSQNNFFILKGKVLDQKQGIPLSKAQVTFIKINKKILTDKEGMFAVVLPAGVQSFRIFSDDYNQIFDSLNIRKDTSIVFNLLPFEMSLYLDEIKVTAQVNKIEQIRPSVDQLDLSQTKKIPAIGSEKDVLKALTFFPGVQSSSEGSSEIQVRGGSSDQNLMLFDNAVMYNSTHIYGVISSFNPSIISNVFLYKAAYPAKFGGRLSSILDATTRTLNLQKFNSEFEISPITSKTLVQFPIIKNKAGLLISYRRTFFDLLQRIGYAYIAKNDINSFNFFDCFIKYTQLINNNNKINLIAYIDRDNNFFNRSFLSKVIQHQNLQYQNKILGLNLESNIISTIQNTLSINYSGYSTLISDKNINDSVLEYFQKFSAIINDFTIKDNIIITPLYTKVKIITGFNYIFHNFSLSNNTFSDNQNTITSQNIPNINSHEFAVYGDLNFNIFPKLYTSMGLRLSDYLVQNKNYYNIEPRLSFNFKINDKNALKASYSKMFQPIHFIVNSGLGMPVNIWLSSDSVLKPETSDQIALAFNKQFVVKKQNYFFSFETYYKNSSNILNYLDGFSSQYFTTIYNHANSDNIDWHDIMTSGISKSYGFELLLAKNSGKLTFQAAYTLSWTTNLFDKLNNGKPFYANNDRRNNFSAYFNYALNKKVEFGYVFVYMTGQPVTLPTSAYYFPYINNLHYFSAYSNVPLFTQSERNKYRMADYYRIDISLKYNIPGKKKKYKSSLSFDIYNVLNRKNPYYYYISAKQDNYNDDNYRYVLKSVSFFPIIPSIGYTYKF